MPKLQQRRRVRSGLPVEVDADETTNRLAVIDRVLNAFVREAKASLGHVHAQHSRQTKSADSQCV